MKCRCTEPGKCETHGGRVMSQKQFDQCRSSDEWFDTFHALGRKCLGLGDRVARVTHAVGIAQAVKAVSKAVGKPGGCGCAKRQDALNAILPAKDAPTAPQAPPSAP